MQTITLANSSELIYLCLSIKSIIHSFVCCFHKISQQKTLPHNFKKNLHNIGLTNMASIVDVWSISDKHKPSKDYA